jgi:tetratricopeptide (TPR) repeat protein
MSDPRYSPRHNVLQAGIFALPILPLWTLALTTEHRAPRLGFSEFVLLWLFGLGISLVLIGIHETAHFVAARAVGIDIAEITIGHWRKLFSVQMGAVRVIVRAAPDSGYVIIRQSLKLFSPFPVSLLLSAGIIAESVVIVAAWQWHHHPKFFPLLFQGAAAEYFRLCIFWIGGLHVLTSLWPSNSSIGGSLLPSDGMQLLSLWKDRADRPRARALFVKCQEVNRLATAREFESALELTESLSKQHPENLSLAKAIGTFRAELGDIDGALQAWEALLKRSGLPLNELVELLDSLSCLPLYHGRIDLLVRADAWSNEALRHAPLAITLKGTRGSVLIELGRLDEGINLLREVLKVSEDSIDQCISHAYLAKAAACKANFTEARTLLAKAVAIQPDHRVVKRIASFISASSASS